MGKPVRVAVALGSNVGDRRAHLDYALSALQPFIANLTLSRYYDTIPAGVSGPQPLFLNAAVIGDASVSAPRLLEQLFAIEQARGRERLYPKAPRTLDLDLILYGDAVLNQPGLVVPHPRFRERRFVLEPLAEIAPAMVDPVSGKTIAELLADL